MSPEPVARPGVPVGRRESLWHAAVEVLHRNWEHDHTVPSRTLYPHQWSWDTGFTAIGWARVAPWRARLELESLLSAQWADGRVPQIVFNPHTPRDAYFPGPDFWGSAGVPGAPERETSGLVQPPLHAAAAWRVYLADPGRSIGFLRRVYPKLRAQQQYLHRARGDGTGLAVIVHPWESGLDNSPSWDAALAEVPVPPGAVVRRRDLDHAGADERPTDLDYQRYVALARRYRDFGYRDAEALPEHPFVMIDPLFNALLAWSEEALADIAEVLGEPSAPHRERAAQVRDAMLERLYHRACGVFHARDAADPTRDPFDHSVAGLIPLLLDLPDDVVDALVRSATGARFALNDQVPLPSHDRTADGFDRNRYWRGPSWVNTSWLVLQGLRRHGHRAEARTLRTALLRSVLGSGFREYFDPVDGAGRGSDEFSWSAALTLDLLAEQGDPLPVPAAVAATRVAPVRAAAAV